MITAAPVTPASWVFAPDRSATAVREPLVLTGNPWNSPAARFAAPIPTISPFPSISCPVRAANAEAVEIVSASDTTAMPSAPANSGPTSASRHVGQGERREPLGQHAHQADAVPGQAEDRGGGDLEHDHDEHGGELGQPALQHQDQRDAADAGRGRRRDRLAVREAPGEPGDLPDQALGIDLEPEQLGQLADQDGQREAVHVADHRRLGDQVGDEAEPRHGPSDHHRPDDDREHRRERDGALRGRRRRRPAARSWRRSSARATSPGRAPGSATGRTPRSRAGTRSTCTAR